MGPPSYPVSCHPSFLLQISTLFPILRVHTGKDSRSLDCLLPCWERGSRNDWFGKITLQFSHKPLRKPHTRAQATNEELSHMEHDAAGKRSRQDRRKSLRGKCMPGGRCQRPGAPGSRTSRVEGQEGTWSDRWSLAVTTCVGRLKPPALESGLLQVGGPRGSLCLLEQCPLNRRPSWSTEGGLHGVE